MLTNFSALQWVRHLQDGTRQYIEGKNMKNITFFQCSSCRYFVTLLFLVNFFSLGATNPEYVVTADDVDKLIAVECIPMDDQGRQVHTCNDFFFYLLFHYQKKVHAFCFQFYVELNQTLYVIEFDLFFRRSPISEIEHCFIVSKR